MDTVSRGEWSRASGELCKAATLAIQQHMKELDQHEDDDDKSEARTLSAELLHHEVAPLLIEQQSTISYGAAADDDMGPYKRSSTEASNGSSGKKLLRQRRESITHILWDECSQMVKLAVPVIGTYLLEMLPGLVSIVLVGHIRSSDTKEYIDAAALAVIYFNLMGLSIGFGLASAMDTLCSQAYGAGNLTKLGIYLQTGIIVLTLAFIVVFLLNYHATTILMLLGQPKLISELAGTFTLYLLPGMPFLFLYELLRKILQAQNVALPMFYISIGANIINSCLGYYLVYYTAWGWLGAAVARTASNMSFCILMMLYLYASNLIPTFWCGWDLRAAWQGLGQFVSLGIPGALQLCFEWWAFECLGLIAGLLPNAVLAIGANAILLNISSMVYMLYLGVSIAGNVRIGNALGAGLPRHASLAAKLTIALGAFCSILCAAFLLGFRTVLPTLFTHDPEIDAYSSELLWIAALFQLPDAINGAVQGIFRGSGRQSLGACLNFAAYYVVGIPLGVVLAFHYGHNVFGLWCGMTIGLMSVASVGTIIISKSDWSSLADEATQRLTE